MRCQAYDFTFTRLLRFWIFSTVFISKSSQKLLDFTFHLQKIITKNILEHQKMFAINQSRCVDAISAQKLSQTPSELGDMLL